jgi:WD40 repeat protein/predicted Ser/Thr protein kinase
VANICPHRQSVIPASRSDEFCPVCFLIELGAGEEGEEGPQFSIPGVTICEEIARGGVGIVYRGEQAEPQRQLAVKVLQPQWARNETIRRRFRREAQAMAALEHRAILPVHEVGETDGLPWFTMKLATGGSLAQRITTYRGQWRQIAELIAFLAEALDFAHQRGVLHRDIKPGNVLFDAEGHPYLGDFGVAKQVTALDFTHTLPSDVLGTPQYLPPEVASGGMENATTSGDIYGLGAVLYELLSGRCPHHAESLPALLRQISDAAPLPLTESQPRPPRDLIAICAKAIEKEPRHRYTTGGEMGEDLRHFLDGKPTLARPVGRLEATWRWCRRHPASAALSALVILLLAVLGVSLAVGTLGIKRAQENAERHLRESLLAQAASIRTARSPGFRERALELAAQAAVRGETAAFRVKRRSEVMSALAFPAVSELPLPAPPAPDMQFATASPDWKFLVWHDARKGTWQLTRTADGSLISSGRGPGRPDYLSIDGRWLVMQEKDKRGHLWLTDAPQASLVSVLDGVVQDISMDARWIAWHDTDRPGRRLAQVREIATGRIAMSVEYPNVPLAMKFSPDSQFCAVAPSFYSGESTVSYSVRIYRCSDGTLIRELAAALGNCVWCMVWSPDGRSLLAAERNGPVYIWDALTGNNRHILRGPSTLFWRAAFSPDGQRLAALGEDRAISVFDLVDGRPLVQTEGEKLNTRAFQWQSDESFGPLLIGGKTALVRFQPGAFATHQAPNAHGGVHGIATSPDERWTALGGARHAWLWDHRHRQALPPFADGLWNAFCFSPDGRWLYGAGEQGVRRWSVNAEGIGEGVELSPQGFHNALATDHSGQLLAFEREQDRRASVLRQPDAEKPECTDFAPSHGLWLDLSHDGKLLASSGPDGLQVWSVDRRRQLYADARAVNAVRFSPDARWLLVAADRYEIWSTTKWKCEFVLEAPGYSSLTAHAAFHPRKPLLAAGCSQGRIGLWSTNDWQLLGVLENPNELPVRRMSFDGNGSKLHFGSIAGIFATWDLDLLEQELKRCSLEW